MTQVEPLLTTSQVAQRLTDAGIPTSDETVRRWADSGRLPSTRTPGGRRWFRAEDVDAILNGTARDQAS